MPAEKVPPGSDPGPRDVPREDAEAALSARRDLGPDYEPEIVDSFVERVDKAIDERVSEALARHQSEIAPEVIKARSKAMREGSEHRLALAIVSLVMAIPLTAIVADTGFEAILLVWVAIVVVNVAFNLSNRFKG